MKAAMRWKQAGQLAGFSLACIAGLLGSATWIFGSPAAAWRATGGVYVAAEASTIDVGDWPAGTTRETRFRLRNCLDRPATVIGAQTLCGCAVVNRLPTKIPPHGVVDIEFQVTAPPKPLRAPWSQTATLQIDVQAAPVEITVRGQITE